MPSYGIHTILYCARHTVENHVHTECGYTYTPHVPYDSCFQQYALRTKQLFVSSMMRSPIGMTSYWIQTVSCAQRILLKAVFILNVVIRIDTMPSMKTVFNSMRCALKQLLVSSMMRSPTGMTNRLCLCATRSVENSFRFNRIHTMPSMKTVFRSMRCVQNSVCIQYDVKSHIVLDPEYCFARNVYR